LTLKRNIKSTWFIFFINFQFKKQSSLWQNPEQRLAANQLQEIIEVNGFKIQIVLSEKHH
jgi:hypothetical protein